MQVGDRVRVKDRDEIDILMSGWCIDGLAWIPKMYDCCGCEMVVSNICDHTIAANPRRDYCEFELEGFGDAQFNEAMVDVLGPAPDDYSGPDLDDALDELFR